MLQFELRHTSEFRDLYGALAGSDLLRYTALLINRVLNTVGTPDDFLGQLSEETLCGHHRRRPRRHAAPHIMDRFNNDAVQHYALGRAAWATGCGCKRLAGQEQLLPLHLA